MSRPTDIPFSKMQQISGSGVFVKRFGAHANGTPRSDAHRDDYFIIVLLTAGTASAEIDFERKQLKTGDILIVSPCQVHNTSDGESCNAEGWILALSPETLSESEAMSIEEYSIAPHPFHPHKNVVADIDSLCSLLERNSKNPRIANALASAVKSFVLSALGTNDQNCSGRYRAITLKLKNLLDTHLSTEKSPSAYASMLSISEVYLNEAVKGATGLSAGAYIRGRAILQAKRQLTYTSLSAKEIAYSLGYEDYAYFSKLFKKAAGISPSEYRKNLK